MSLEDIINFKNKAQVKGIKFKEIVKDQEEPTNFSLETYVEEKGNKLNKNIIILNISIFFELIFFEFY